MSTNAETGSGAGGHPSTGIGSGVPPRRQHVVGRPPEILVNGPVVLRRHSSDDCQLLVDAVNRSHGELREWMPWAQAPATPNSLGEFLGRSQAAWEEGREFNYAIRSADTGDGVDADGVIGSCGLHFRDGPGVAEIGYWVRSDRTGAGVATAAATALTRAALELPEVVCIEIHCDAENVASRSVPAKIGYRLDRIDPRPEGPRTPAETDRIMIWVHPGRPT